MVKGLSENANLRAIDMNMGGCITQGVVISLLTWDLTEHR